MHITEWEYIQKNADQILIGGLNQLHNSKLSTSIEVIQSDAGNYLIYLQDRPHYIGEGKVLSNRIKQQFNPKTSTFYKSYLKINQLDFNPIEDFRVKVMNTLIGRKEVEEIGIVNFKTSLNRFQLNKRSEFVLAENEGWEYLQTNSNRFLELSESLIMSKKFDLWGECYVERTPGVYIVRDSTNQLIYIGESSDIYDRHKTHSKTTYFSALRRHVATELLGLQLSERNGKKKYLDQNEDLQVSRYLNNCSCIFYPVKIGRYEIEEYLIKKYKPLLNRKDNK
ncbi:GIY-YIG nuclease family protein [Sphingobacterium sp.]|uniref:GIY-YIG nuclease family protein n=1 Tax=Sphingobacterium sp. TaxID=341027 RepID=UPI00289DD4DF|nr:GIY-YIG nuclease family protein [Sphingobacterium sp.]